MKRKNIFILWSCLSFLFLSASCAKEDASDNHNIEAIPTYFTTSLKSINEDTEYFEDRVTELRLLVFNSATGAMVFNNKLNFRNGFNRTSEPVKLEKGEHDFYFIANETSGGVDFIDALKSVDNVFKFKNDPRFWNLTFDENFKPSQNAGIVMSARYQKVDVPDGYTKTNPWPFKGAGFKVQLIRSFAKVELIFTKTKEQDPDNETQKRITSVQLVKIPKKFSVPPMDVKYSSLFSNNLTQTAVINPDISFDYTKDIIGTLVFYIPEFLREQTESDDGNTAIMVKGKGFSDKLVPIDHQYFNDYNQVGHRDLNISVLSKFCILRNTHYKLTFHLKKEVEVFYKVRLWERTKTQTVMGYGFYVEIEDHKKITITNTEVCEPPFKVTLKPLNGTVIDGSSSEIHFVETQKGVSKTYTLDYTPVSGEYLEIIYNGNTLKKISKP
ncbi:Major fimbrial subunit protein (FimA) [Porphyromonas macacae]|uniref:Major fimbrial subunit protein (FimA) n=1 Tax=Porphyromonas macacae TaxID=28115 RepID=A0A379E963_9PORP|nr:hypothetical protein [Porphyromonas macacae]SUB88891.1 Major fimbrial subunit protein (FimA) [Porphyromonas macacae]